MAYFKINNIDYSMYVNKLNISDDVEYNAQTNAAGDTVVDYINRKRTIEVGIIPLDSVSTKKLLTAIKSFTVSISFINPVSNTLEENVACIIPSNSISYYTIRADKTMVNGFTLKFIEL